MSNNPEGKKPLVVVAMSGGVDSSLAAFLLHQKSYQVVGMSMKLWDYKEVGGQLHPDGHCCSLDSLNDARAVCEKIGIPHYVVDLRDDFKKEVISDFVDEYLKGRTPNPCIICNTKIKWDSLWKKAQSVNADSIATGHYARVEYDRELNRFLLLKGVDSTRDQSYALWSLTQRDLSRSFFPLGDLTKKQVRDLAKGNGLKVADKEESEEICFVTDNDYPRFIREWLENQGKGGIKPGPILNLKGEKIGEHPGIQFYTIGQRKGLKIAVGRPLYVVRIDAERNVIIVGEDGDLFKSSFTVSNPNWIAFENLEKEIDCEIKIRYQHKPQKGRIYPLTGGKVKSRFNKPERAITPGQSAVFYKGEVVVGGGVIDRVFDENASMDATE
ncbi:MAG TPA: tRNA 2-thiouridine(34) synthase MnmA [candidate division Zixibacteria bacterium]